jgi:hypothetical protein
VRLLPALQLHRHCFLLHLEWVEDAAATGLMKLLVLPTDSCLKLLG